MLIILILIAFLTFSTVNLWRYRNRLPKGPIPLPFIGNFHQIGYYSWKNGGVVAGFQEFKKQYGKVFTLWMGPIPTVSIADYDIAYETHVKRANIFGHRYSKGGMNYLREGRGIIASNGDLLDDFKKSNWKNGGIEVHAVTCFDYLVGSIINQLLVSKRFIYGDPVFEKLKANLLMTIESLSLVDAFAPLWLLKSDLMKWRTKTTLAPFDFIFSVVEDIVNKRLASIKSGEHVIGEEGDDFVDAFLLKLQTNERDGIESSLDLESLKIDLYDLWLAGQETTSTTLTWACACLLNHPEVITKTREELIEITGGNTNVSLTDRPKTSYLNAVINVDEDLFKNNSEFCPERFLENSGLEKKLIPFGIGKRACLGESLARAELYLILGNLIMEYDLEPIGKTPEIKTTTLLAVMRRPPAFDIRFVPVDI
uniref:Cytochrome P450 n=1 Tax=Caenorhabditis tropicalis TaxID=1561998 RepID=A0A1I7TXU4_9PELO